MKSCFCQSSIGKKITMAVSGLFLLGFVFAHLAGNLLIFAGPEALNAYALKLSHLGLLLWAARLFLLAMLTAHMVTAVWLTIENRKARPIPYSYKDSLQITYAGRTMALSGLIVFAFVIYHLLHFTFRITHPAISHLKDSLGSHDVYSMVVLSFQESPIAISYVVAMLLLSLHLSHGIASMLQTLGLNNDLWKPRLIALSRLVALLIFIGYSSIPLSVLAGLIKTQAGVS